MADYQTTLIIGSGGIGEALRILVRERYPAARHLFWSRGGKPAVDILDESSIIDAVEQSNLADLDLVIDATGFLHDQQFRPEKSWREIDAAHLAHAFAVNAIGPALLMKHLLPCLRRKRRSVFATLSARVGSIGDNRLGGWHAYRASKAGLNQLVRCHAIELSRRNSDAICVAIHPGTVDTRLSKPFSKSGLNVRAPEIAAAEILDVLEGLGASDSGRFFDHQGAVVPY